MQVPTVTACSSVGSGLTEVIIRSSPTLSSIRLEFSGIAGESVRAGTFGTSTMETRDVGGLGAEDGVKVGWQHCPLSTNDKYGTGDVHEIQREVIDAGIFPQRSPVGQDEEEEHKLNEKMDVGEQKHASLEDRQGEILVARPDPTKELHSFP